MNTQQQRVEYMTELETTTAIEGALSENLGDAWRNDGGGHYFVSLPDINLMMFVEEMDGRMWVDVHIYRFSDEHLAMRQFPAEKVATVIDALTMLAPI